MIPPNTPTRAPQSRKPRASGDDPGADACAVAVGEVNPARAGMIPAPPTSPSPPGGKPRASGDDPVSREIQKSAFR